MESITVRNFIHLMYGEKRVWIFISGRTYEFEVEKLPNCILDSVISTIDSPEYYSYVHPLCINIFDEENNIDGEQFRETYSDFEI